MGIANALTQRLTEVKRKIEQESQQIQGKIQEIALEKLLTDTFSFDQITEVGKAVNEVDLIQEVRK